MKHFNLSSMARQHQPIFFLVEVHGFDRFVEGQNGGTRKLFELVLLAVSTSLRRYSIKGFTCPFRRLLVYQYQSTSSTKAESIAIIRNAR